MNEELQKHAADLLLMLKSGIEKGTQLAGEKLPDLAYQYVLWGRAYVTIGFLTIGALTGFCLWVFYQNAVNNRWNLKEKYHPDEWSAGRVVLAIVTGIPGALLFIATMDILSKFIMVWFAPKIWLLQEIAKVLK